MPIQVIAEHFELPEHVEKRIEATLDRVQDLASPDATIHLFMKKRARYGFQATITVHLGHEDLAYTAEGNDLPSLIKSMKTHIVRQLVSKKEKRVHARKRKGAPPVPAAS